MACHTLSHKCLFRFIGGYNSSQRFNKNNFCAFTNDSIPQVIHDRQNQRFTIACDGDDKSVLKYTSGGDGRVELISTEVPESHRGKGVAAHLAKAALDFVIEEDLKARISCWYIRKYVDENPHLGYQAYIKD